MTELPGFELGRGIEATLPSSWYFDQEIFNLEREHIFLKEWLCVARLDDLPKGGDHLVVDVMGESIILLRKPDGALRAFYNVCRHRGARLCATRSDPFGSQELPIKGGVKGGQIVCPYHAWTYDFDGQLKRAPFMSPEMGFAIDQIRLHQVAVDHWGGYVFVNLTPESARPFADHIKFVAETYGRYPMADLKVSRTIHYEIEANWKVLCENYNECYHCGPVHPELCSIVPAFREKGGAGLDWKRGVPHRDGATTFTKSGESTRRSFPGLNDDELVRHKGELLYPNVFFSFAREHVAVFIFQPVSPTHTSLDCHFLFEPYEMEKDDFDDSDAVDFWHLVNRQDWTICEQVQKGMSSRVHQRGIFSPMEDWNLDIRKYVTDRIGPYVGER